jgi:ABC-type glycerol-3-phosphate transport system substrate-binding protein
MTRAATWAGRTALIPALAACGAAGAGGDRPAASAQPVTLRVNHRTEKYIPEVGKSFTAKYPHITVEYLPDTGYEKLIAQLAAGDVGDLIWLSTGVGTYFELASQGHLMQLDPISAADKYDLKQLFPRTIAVAKIVDNKQFGMPNLIHPSHVGLFYNKSLFETTGVKPPTMNSTYDELATISRQIMAAKPGTWGIVTETSFPALLVFVRSFGGEMLDPPTLGKRSALDKGPAKQALQWLWDLRHKHKVQPLPDQSADFNRGDVAMFTTGMWGQTRQAQIGDRFQMDAVLVPKGPGGKRGSQGHVDMWGMSAKTKYKDQAWLLMKQHTSREVAPLLFGEHGIPGARPDAWADTVSKASPMFKIFKDFMDNPGPDQLAVPWNLRMQDMQTVTAKELEPLWKGEESVDAGVARALGPIQAQLDLPRPGAK